MFNLTTEDFARECCDCYSKLLTFDFKGKHEANKKYAGEFLNSKPLELFGANVIKLDVKGKQSKVTFEGENDPATDGYAYRLVAVNADAKATYGDISTSPRGTVSLKLPADTQSVYLVVTGFTKGDYKPSNSRRNQSSAQPHIFKYHYK